LGVVSVKKFKCIAADPNWPESGGGRIKRGADRHYPCIKKSECPHKIIQTIYQSGVWNPDPSGCHLWLWVTNNYLEHGLFVMKALGFRYVNNIPWNKVSENGKQQKGLGQYFFGAHELCLFGVMGRLRALNRVPTSFDAPRTKNHSEKPEFAYRRIETVSPGPRLELYATAPRRGWKVWGPKNHRGAPL
jgi:N6-adenosine-specific RNA methylase IME4